MLGGQGSRPSVSHRHFSPSLSWFAGTTLAIFGLVLASVLALLSLRASLSFAFKRLALSLDKALTQSTKGVRQRATSAGPSYDLQPLSSPTNFANLVYSLVGSLDAASPYVPTYKASPLTCSVLWEASPLALPLNGWASRFGTQNDGSAPFRSYLGEWRRLLDESLTSTAAHNPQGYIQTTRSRLAPLSSKARTCVDNLASARSTGPSTSSNATPYSLYLSTPWVF